MSIYKPKPCEWWMRYVIDSLGSGLEDTSGYVFNAELDYNNGCDNIVYLQSLENESETESEDEDYYYSMLFV